ncbi:sushi, von Willebrand factor type A, EGF and pentraxin domain-containing protein 1-like isoform X2 [Pygocentrus nattereri]|uniref:sushi, von Willebrand factor type A, EGF and pentraxin domain-containing protein 1-like isoform X2 n=1 Tax=Pygocentrus nattereri TaxID=42514 RepID=UPI0018913D91|nr:sushi, von Willebrand factor type A, EGF and pentraxin domain-containing protein 1-like isoform X2 [Pygocentrus nattereri]
MTSNCHNLFIFLVCLLNVAKIRAQCEVPRAGDQRVLTPESNKPTYSDGDTVTFQCIVGYRPVNPKTYRTLTCSGNSWDYSTLELQCTKKTCGPLPDFPNGRYTYSPDGAEGILFGATATAECNEGYRLLRYPDRHCRDSGWDGREPVCEVVKCLPPPEILNGQPDEPLEDVYEYGQAVTYICNAGYTRFGDSIVSCSSEGTFQPSPPECKKVYCDPPNVPNGKRIHGRPPFTYKSTIQFACNVGFKMVGSGSLVCERNGWNSSPPNCTEIRCEPLPDFPNGTYTYSPEGAEGILFGATATAECNEGYWLLRYTARHCRAFGWDGREPVCKVVKCFPPPEILNGQPEEPLLDEYEYGQAVTYVCNAGYTRSGDSTVSCSNNGLFQPSPPECKKKTCGPLPDFPNGRYIYSPEGAEGILFGATATAECNEGYRLLRYTARHCQASGWDGREPVCEGHCEEPSVEHNRVLTPDSIKSAYSNGDTAKFQCSAGCEPVDPKASRTITCSGSKWDYSTLKLQCTCKKLEFPSCLTSELLEIEREKLKLYRDRLAVEKERLQLDKDKLEVIKSSLTSKKKSVEL